MQLFFILVLTLNLLSCSDAAMPEPTGGSVLPFKTTIKNAAPMLATIGDRSVNAVTPVVIVSMPITVASNNLCYSYDVDAQAFNPTNQLVFALEDAPIGMTIDNNTGSINWTPSDQQVGRQDVAVVVSDSNTPPFSARQTFQIDVRDNLPVFPGNSWTRSTPDSQGVDAVLLADAINFLDSLPAADKSNELVIVKDGYVIWRGSNVDNVHGVWSLTKSLVSTLFGLLADDQKVTLDTPASGFDANLNPNYPTVTMRHFLTMSSGYRAIGDQPRGNYVHGTSQTPFEPDVPLFTPPGSQFAYWDSAANELGLMITRIAGKSMQAFFQERIGSVIGLDSGAWDWGDFGQIDGFTINGGAGNNGNHVLISAIDLARFGHLILNRGYWNGVQLIDPAWIDAATDVQVPVDMPWAGIGSDHLDGRCVYGYFWWRNGLKPDGNPKWPGGTPGTFAASGANNNKLFIVPERNMVIVRLGLDGGQATDIQDAQWGQFLSLVEQAVIGNKPDGLPVLKPE